MKRTLPAVILLATVPTLALAQQTIKPVKLDLPLTPAPARALKVRLLPEVRDQVPGNAAEHYRKAVPLLKKLSSGRENVERQERLSQWSEMPPDKLPRDKVREELKPYDEAIAHVEAGARREYCDWGLADELRKAGLGVTLDDWQQMRGAATVLALRARLELAEGRPDRAAATLRHGFALARHAGEQPTLICSLIGVAVTAVMQRQLEALVQHPGAANLYWALTDLPQPYISLRVPLQGERLMFIGTFPGLGGAGEKRDAEPWTDAQVKKVVNVLSLDIGRRLELPEVMRKAEMALLIQTRHEAAKKALVVEGWQAARLDKMPHVQVALLHAQLEYDEKLDAVMKLQNLSYHEAREPLRELERTLRVPVKARPSDAPAVPLADLFVPAAQKVFMARTRADRRFQALRTVEAVRLYALKHEGKLPAKLSDITEVPVPADPATGKPFLYEVSGGTATLKGQDLPEWPRNQGSVVWYEITLKK